MEIEMDTIPTHLFNTINGGEVMLVWHIDNASFLNETPDQHLTSPPLTIANLDITWRILLQPQGLSQGPPASCHLLQVAGKDRAASWVHITIITPRVMATASIGPCIIRLNEGITFETFNRKTWSDRLDRVTVLFRYWLEEAPRPLMGVKGTSSCNVSKLTFVATSNTGGGNLLVEESVRECLKSNLQLDLWTPDEAMWGLTVRLGTMFQTVQSVRATFTLAHRSPIDARNFITTPISRIVMFRRLRGGLSFEVPPFIPKGPVTLVGELESFYGELFESAEPLSTEDEFEFYALQGGKVTCLDVSDNVPVDVAEQKKNVVVVYDVEERIDSSCDRLRSCLSRAVCNPHWMRFTAVLVASLVIFSLLLYACVVFLMDDHLSDQDLFVKTNGTEFVYKRHVSLTSIDDFF